MLTDFRARRKLYGHFFISGGLRSFSSRTDWPSPSSRGEPFYHSEVCMLLSKETFPPLFETVSTASKSGKLAPLFCNFCSGGFFQAFPRPESERGAKNLIPLFSHTKIELLEKIKASAGRLWRSANLSSSSERVQGGQDTGETWLVPLELRASQKSTDYRKVQNACPYCCNSKKPAFQVDEESTKVVEALLTASTLLVLQGSGTISTSGGNRWKAEQYQSQSYNNQKQCCHQDLLRQIIFIFLQTNVFSWLCFFPVLQYFPQHHNKHANGYVQSHHWWLINYFDNKIDINLKALQLPYTFIIMQLKVIVSAFKGYIWSK